jgi:hypothetical protein
MTVFRNEWIMVIMITAIQKATSNQSDMYYADKFNGEMQHDCLRYTVPDELNSNLNTPLSTHQLILFCFRSIQSIDIDQKIKATIISNNNESVSCISTSDLFIWSAPIGVIERYAAYFINKINTDADHQQTFYNCTIPWFGPIRQCTFDTNSVFFIIVKSNFEEQNWFDMKIRNENTICCLHLPCTHSSCAPMCID